MPIIGINEVLSLKTITGGAIILLAIIVQGLFTRKRHATLKP